MKMFPLPLSLVLLACSEPTPFAVDVVNAGNDTRYVDFTGGEVVLHVWGELLGGWQALEWQLSCARRCGRPQAEPCPDLAFAPMVLALEPGDSVQVQKDGTAWETSRDLYGDCRRPIDLEGALRLASCHGADAELLEDVGNGEYQGQILDPVCTEVEFSLPEQTDVEIEIGP